MRKELCSKGSLELKFAKQPDIEIKKKFQGKEMIGKYFGKHMQLFCYINRYIEEIEDIT